MKDLITEARELCEKATPGPWYTWENWMVHTETDVQSNGIPPNKVIGTFNKQNPAFIARSRTLIPELCDALEKAQEQRWIPATERLPDTPKYSEPYNVQVSNCSNRKVMSLDWVKTTVRGKEICRWEWHGRVSCWNVTHWMPLPAASEKEGE